VKTLEGREDALLMAGFNSQAVVFYAQDALAFMPVCTDAHLRGPTRMPVLKRVPDQVLEQLRELQLIRYDRGKVSVKYLCVRLPDFELELGEHIVYH